MECPRQEQPIKKKVEFVGLESNKVELEAIRQERKKKKVELEAIRQERKNMADQNQRRAFLQAALVGGDGTAEARTAARSIRDLQGASLFLQVYDTGGVGCCAFFMGLLNADGEKQKKLQQALASFDTWQSNETLCGQLDLWKGAAVNAEIYNEVAEEFSLPSITASTPSRDQSSFSIDTPSTPSSGQASLQTVNLSVELGQKFEHIVSCLSQATISNLTRGGGQVNLDDARGAFVEVGRMSGDTEVHENVKAVLDFIDDGKMSRDDRANTVTYAIRSSNAFSSDDSGVASHGTAPVGGIEEL